MTINHYLLLQGRFSQLEMKNQCDKMVLYILFDTYNGGIDYDLVDSEH